MLFLRKTASMTEPRPLIHAFLLQTDIMVGDGKPAMTVDNVCPEFDVSVKLKNTQWKVCGIRARPNVDLACQSM